MPRPKPQAAAATPSEYDLPAAIYVPLEKLKPWAKNPRKNDHVVDELAAGMRRFGFGAPLIARQENGEIIAGHTRLKAAIKLKLTHVPVRYMDLSEQEAHLLALADNRLGEKAAWDDGALLELLQSFAPGDRGVAGWDDKDMAALERAAGKSGDVVEDEAPPLPKNPITQLGDVWQLGRHRLICGDSTAQSTYTRLLAGRKVGLMVTDPPYGVEAHTGTKDVRSATYRKGEERNRIIDNDELSGDKLEDFLRGVFAPTAAVALAPGAAWYVWHASVTSMPFLRALETLGGMKHQLIWVKTRFVFSRCDYHYKHEPCFYGWLPGAGRSWLGSRDQSTVLDVAYDKAIGELVHPSVKPVELYAIPIRNHLGADGALIDQFAGTGPAFSAAEQLDRTCYGIELSPAYCDVIVGRWERLSGGKAVRSGASGTRTATSSPKTAPSSARETASKAPHSRSKKGKSSPAAAPKKKAPRARAS